MEMMNGQKPTRHFFVERGKFVTTVYLNGAFFARMRTDSHDDVLTTLQGAEFSRDAFRSAEMYALPASGGWHGIDWGFFKNEKIR